MLVDKTWRYTMVKKVQEKKLNTVNEIEEDRLEVPTVLSLLDYDENVMSDVQKEILEEEISELEPIKEGQLNVFGIYAYDLGDKFEVKAYVRNGLSSSVTLGYIPFIISNSKNKTLAYQIFNLESLGEIPSHSARPVKLYFQKKNVYVDSIPMDDWNLAFDTKVDVKRRVRVEYENLPKDIEVEEKIVFDNFLKELPELNQGEFTVSTFSIGVQKNGNILVTLVMRNGTSKPINLEKIPMTVKDANGTVVKSNLFELNDFSVSPHRVRICNFAFPTGLTLEQDVALDNWKVEYKLQKVAEDSKNTK
jgi:SLAP domain-containing protein